MDSSGLVSLSADSVVSSKLEAVANAFSTKVVRKSLDIVADQGEGLIRLMDEAGGRGRNINTSA